MSSSIAIAEIRNSVIKGLLCQFAPLITISLVQFIFNLDSVSDLLPAAISLLLTLYILGLFWWGYIICWRTAYKYAEYKGYSKRFGLLGIFNIFGLAILLLLSNKNVSSNNSEDRQPFENLSLIYLALGSLVIVMIASAILSFFLITFAGVRPEQLNNYINNLSMTSYSYYVPLLFGTYLAIALFISREVKQANIEFSKIIGSWKPKNIQLAISVGVALFLLTLGLNRLFLYLLTFVAPQYVLSEVNRGTDEITAIWIIYNLVWLIVIPLYRETIFQGIAFQKLSIAKDSIFKGIHISILIYTVIGIAIGQMLTAPISGLVQIILYLKTKQIVVPAISNFVCNGLYFARIYLGIALGQEYFTSTISIADYQGNFTDYLALNILFIALSVPYLGYFIYRHYPRSSKISNLPYFYNQR